MGAGPGFVFGGFCIGLSQVFLLACFGCAVASLPVLRASMCSMIRYPTTLFRMIMELVTPQCSIIME